MKNSNYDLHPIKKVVGYDSEAFQGNEGIVEELLRKQNKGNGLVVCDLYPGTQIETVIDLLKSMKVDQIFFTDACKKNDLYIEFENNITDDPVFGQMTYRTIKDCFKKDKIAELKDEIESSEGMIAVVGTGAAAWFSGDMLLYFDIPRWEIQKRLRKGMGNWLIDNPEAPILTKFKIGYFIEWRLADQNKKEIFKEVDYFFDTVDVTNIKMISQIAMQEALKSIVKGPFRLQPYFDAGVWGGQWMKKTFGLDENSKNYAWSFDGVPEENSIRFQFGEIEVEMPCMNLVQQKPCELLGERVYGRFGDEFPIRFDLLDTMGGQNLSLQVHPLTEYIQKQFGMHYTQDESYYLLEAAEDAHVYLGVKENVNPKEMEEDLYLAQEGKMPFPAEKYVNRIPVKKHDHCLIPAGTIHCSGANTMVLEISATPYIFTFKLWDWGRVDLNGRPRPIHLAHGLKNIQFERTTNYVHEQLIHQETILKESAQGTIEKTGLHPRESIETLRYTINTFMDISMNDSVHMLNLVEGESAVIESVSGEFETFTVHYCETFMIPAQVAKYRIVNHHSSPIKIMCAYIR